MESMYTKDLIEELKAENITPENLPRCLIESLKESGKKIASAESCTGGLISQMITSVSGASQVFDCGVCTYSNEMKMKIINVKRATLESEGAVSESTACQMAQGVRLLADADIGISTTGIAGPDGGTDVKPVGLVYIGCSTEERTFCIKAEFCADTPKSRQQVRTLAAATALLQAYKTIQLS